MGRIVSPEKQFSKKLASRTGWFWFGYMVLVIVAIAYQPDAALYLFMVGLLVSVVMETSVLAYTHNSEYEKGLWATIQTARIGFLKKGGTGTDDPDEDITEDDETDDDITEDDGPEESDETEEGEEDG